MISSGSDKVSQNTSYFTKTNFIFSQITLQHIFSKNLLLLLVLLQFVSLPLFCLTLIAKTLTTSLWNQLIRLQLFIVVQLLLLYWKAKLLYVHSSANNIFRVKWDSRYSSQFINSKTAKHQINKLQNHVNKYRVSNTLSFLFILE